MSAATPLPAEVFNMICIFIFISYIAYTKYFRFLGQHIISKKYILWHVILMPTDSLTIDFDLDFE